MDYYKVFEVTAAFVFVIAFCVGLSFTIRSAFKYFNIIIRKRVSYLITFFIVKLITVVLDYYK